MTRLILGFAILTFTLPINVCSAQTLDVLPKDLAPNVPKTEMMAVWLKGQVMDALDRRDAAFEKLTNEELVIWQKDRRAFFRAATWRFSQTHAAQCESNRTNGSGRLPY